MIINARNKFSSELFTWRHLGLTQELVTAPDFSEKKWNPEKKWNQAFNEPGFLCNYLRPVLSGTLSSVQYFSFSKNDY